MLQHTFVHVCIMCECVRNVYSVPSLYVWECTQVKCAKSSSAWHLKRHEKKTVILFALQCTYVCILWLRPLHAFFLLIFNVLWNAFTLSQLGFSRLDIALGKPRPICYLSVSLDTPFSHISIGAHTLGAVPFTVRYISWWCRDAITLLAIGLLCGWLQWGNVLTFYFLSSIKIF